MTRGQLLDHYSSLERSLRPVARADWAPLVVPNGNAGAPFHGWFHLKEAFSSNLVEELAHELGLANQDSPLRVLDPFAGGGTTLVSALQTLDQNGTEPMHAAGIELNPFLHFLAEVKVRALAKRPKQFSEYASRLVTHVQRGRAEPRLSPGLSTLSNTTYFPRSSLRQLLELLGAIDELPAPPLTRDLARLCVASAIEPSSRLRRDGRALRYEPSKTPLNPLVEFQRRADIVSMDLRGPRTSGHGRVYRGDARAPGLLLPKADQYDLILFSPPYPNNLDYTEIYKLENWLLGFIDSQEQFKAQRLLTLRSHPSVQFPDEYVLESNGHRSQMVELLAPLLREIPKGRYESGRTRLIRGYFDDLGVVLLRLRSFLKPKGYLVYVVGNSMHGTATNELPIATDLLIAAMAKWLGYEVDGFFVARRPARRSLGPLVRESVVILRKG